MKLKKKLLSITLALTMILAISLPVLAQTWLAYYPTIVIDSSGGDRTAVPVITGIEGQDLIDAGVLSTSGLDSRMRLAGTDIPYMLSTTQIPTYLDSLPALGQAQVDLYTSYSDPADDFDIITGTDGYITITDDDTDPQEALELGSDFEIEQKGYVDTTGGADVNLVYKEDAFRTYIDGANAITSSILNLSINLIPISNGDYTNITNATANHWDDVDDPVATPDEGATTVSEPAGAYLGDVYNLSGLIPSAATIDTVTIYFRLNTTVGGANCTPILRLGGVDLDGTEKACPVGWTTYNEALTRPGGGDWVATDIMALQAGIKLKTTNTAAECTQVYVVVDYHLEITATPIASGEYTVKTYGVANEPDWATGDVLHFTRGLDSYIDCGIIHNASAKLWLSLWLRLDSTFDAGSANTDSSWMKWAGANDQLGLTLLAADGRLQFGNLVGGVWAFRVWTAQANWTADTWYHIIASISDVAGARLIVDGGTPVVDADNSAAPNGGNFIVGDYTIDGTGGITGEIQNVIVGTDDLTLLLTGTNTDLIATNLVTQDVSGATGYVVDVAATWITVARTNAIAFVAGQDVVEDGDATDLLTNVLLSTDEEANLYAGIAPGDETNYWYIDEGTGTGVDAVKDYGTAPSDGDIDAACSWETSTYTTGKTGRLCDFYIEVDDGVLDADRWGANLKGASVPANANDWYLNQNNVMPWMDYYYHTVGGVQHAWYQPNYMVEATDYDGEETAGGSDVLITDAGILGAGDYWVGGLVTITASAGAALGESRICTTSNANTITVAPAFSANIAIGDDFTVDFGTLIDRSYYGLDFDGASGDIVVTDAASIQNIFDGGGTIECWINPSSDGEANEGRIAMKIRWNFQCLSEDATKVKLRFQQNFDITNGVWTTTATEVEKDVWSHLVVTYNSDDVTNDPIIYVNGNSVALTESFTPADTRITDVGDDIYIGNQETDARTFDGLIDEIGLYTRILEQNEVTANYNAGVGNYTPYSTTGLVGQWHIETGSGVGAIIVDSSGNGNTGTLAGATWVNGKVPRPAGNSGTNDSRLTWGVNSSITLVYGEPVNYTTTASGLSGEGGYTVAEADMPAEWYGTATNLVNLPLYDMFVGINVSTGIPIQTLYVFVIITLCFAFSVAGFLMFNSVMASIIGIGIALGIGSAMTVVPMWIFFTFLIMAVGILYLKGRAVFG